MFMEKKCELSANEIYAKFIHSERKYGHLSTFSDQFSSKWKHLRVSTSLSAFWNYYECPQEISRQLICRDFCPDATKALFLICNCASVKSYQIGDLLKLRADPNCQSGENGDTPLHRLIRLCKVKAVRLLVSWGADINRTNNIGRTPLMAACDCGESKKELLVVNYLLRNKSLDLNAKDDEGNTAVTLAVRASNIWTLRELLLSGTSVTAVARRGRLFSADDSTSSKCSLAHEFSKNSIISKKVGDIDSNGADGIQWTDKSMLTVESIRRPKEEVCFLMIQRKATEEFSKINQGHDRLKTMQKVYRKGDRNFSPKKEPKVKLQRTSSLKSIDSKSDMGEESIADTSSICLEDIDLQRDKKEFDKRKREKKPHRSHRRKSDNRKDADNQQKPDRASLISSVDNERVDQMKTLRSGLRSSLRSSVVEKKEKKSKKFRSPWAMSPPPPSPSPFEQIRSPKSVTFKDDLNSYESLNQWS